MKLQNNTKSNIRTSKGIFKIKSIIDFDKAESAILLKYKGVDSVEALEASIKITNKAKKEAKAFKAQKD